MTERARGDDPIWWTPRYFPNTIEHQATKSGVLVHRCPSAVVVAQVPRDQLDYMALGTCRYCDEPMPA